MVSLRRRRLLGLCSGVQNSVTDDPVNAAGENDDINSNPAAASVNPMLLHDLNLPPTDIDDIDEGYGTPNVGGCSQPEEQNKQLNACVSSSSRDPAPGVVVVKRRKQYRRRGVNNHVSMRGVYLKNSKWQAAIKVDKKQIHLGTLNSQDDAVKLYDRAAFMCGREPNFELSEEVKQELRKLEWDDFLAMTRKAVHTNRTRRRRVKRSEVHSDQGSDDKGAQATETPSSSDDAEPDRSTSILH